MHWPSATRPGWTSAQKLSYTFRDVLLRIVFLAGLTLGLGPLAVAEPWISNRFAQNCASCHAPSRINLPARDRRCTLSCQGCHVNPQGGGLRNYYGFWTQRRWLRSFYTDRLLTEKKRPAPFRNQLYAPQGTKGTLPAPAPTSAPGGGGGGEDDDLQALSAIAQQAQGAPARTARGPSNATAAPASTAPVGKVPRNGFPTVVWERDDYDERDYDRSDGSEKQIAGSRDEFLARVTADDPYRDERRNAVAAGGDARFIALLPTSSEGGRKTGLDIWLMSVDFGVRFRPVPENFRVVLEGRSMAGPTQKALDQAFTAESQIRSAYVLIDDLPYNSYFQYGLYRPMFGNYDGNHLSLSASVTGLNQRAVFLAASVGASPNVPFVNLSYLRPLTDVGENKAAGFVVTVGGRWVKLGASAGLSYWDTSENTPTGPVNRRMVALTGGMKLGQAILNGEILYVRRENVGGATDAGNTITIEGRYKLWREIYAQLSFATSNTSPNLKPGDARQYSLGLRGFFTAGLDLDLSYISRRYKENGVPGGYDGFQSQLHLYF